MRLLPGYQEDRQDSIFSASVGWVVYVFPQAFCSIQFPQHMRGIPLLSAMVSLNLPQSLLPPSLYTHCYLCLEYPSPPSSLGKFSSSLSEVTSPQIWAGCPSIMFSLQQRLYCCAVIAILPFFPHLTEVLWGWRLWPCSPLDPEHKAQYWAHNISSLNVCWMNKLKNEWDEH